jgi:hypothetical protein
MREQSRRNYFAALFGGVPLAGIFLIVTPRRRRSVGIIGLMLLLMLVVTLPACGGGGGGGGNHQNSGTPAGTYTVTLNATSGSQTASPQFTLTVQ